jgi:hypothetical protein
MSTYTIIHVLISLIGIGSGFVVLYGLLTGSRLDFWTHIFLGFTLLTTLTGFGFPLNAFTPAIGTGIASLIALIPAIAGRYVFHMRGRWRAVYVIGSIFAFYFNFFVLIVQSFQKLPTLNALAPTGSEPPFAVAQGVALLFFIAVGYLSARRFHPA